MKSSQLLTPKQVARAMEVSESSVKRWCDKGLISTQYTAGGHRRIALPGLLAFLREHHYELVRPDVLGLPATAGHTQRVIDRGAEQLVEALLAGDEECARRVVLDLYLAEHRVSAIGDLVISRAFEVIGERWECGEAEVFQERRSCEITLRILRELRTLGPQPAADAPLAIGGAVQGDQYNLATTLAELVLREGNWNAISLGDNLPYATLAAAIERLQPRLFWISASHMASADEFLRGYQELYAAYGRQVAFVVGGRALHGELRQHMKYAAYCDQMRHLEGFAQSLLAT